MQIATYKTQSEPKTSEFHNISEALNEQLLRLESSIEFINEKINQIHNKPNSDGYIDNLKSGGSPTPPILDMTTILKNHVYTLTILNNKLVDIKNNLEEII